MILLVMAILLPWLFAVLGGWLVYQLFLQNGRILRRLAVLEQQPAPIRTGSVPAPGPPGLPVGILAPDFRLGSLTGARKQISDWRGQRLLLIFFNPRCGFCSQMVPDLAALPVDPAGGRPLPVVVTTGSLDENRKLFKEHGLRCPALLQEGGEVASQYRATGTPMGYLIDEDGRIASGLAVGAEALLALAGTTRPAVDGKADPVSAVPGVNGHRHPIGNRPLSESRLNRGGLAAGTLAPSFRVPRVDGGEISLDQYRGQRVLLVFSDPHCGPCDELAPRLEQAARDRPDVQTLMVSRGDAEVNRRKVAQLGLSFPVGLQRQWEISKLYAMFATPIAYLIDEAGRTAADAAVGVEPILALLTNSRSSAQARQREASREGAAVGA